MNETIEIRLKGQGVSPGLIRSHEIAELIEAFEDFVSAEAARSSPEVRRDELVVGLYAIADASIGLKFKAGLAAVNVPAFVAAAAHLAAGNFHELSPHSLRALQKVVAFAKRHGAVAELKMADASEPLAVVTADTVIPEEPRIRGLAEIAAKTLRVGESRERCSSLQAGPSSTARSLTCVRWSPSL